MHISHLREFVELVRCLSFSEAARNLNTAQSTLSKHVLALEKECGAEVLTRSSAQVRLTQEGQALFEGAIDIIETHDRTLERIAALKRNPPIVVGGLYRNAHILRFVTSIVNRQRKSGTPLTLSYRNLHHRPYVEMLQKGELDVAFTMQEHDANLPAGIDRIHLFDDPLVAIMAKDHPLADNETLVLEDIDHQSMLSPDGGYAIAGAELARKIFASKGVRPLYRPVFIQSAQDFPTLDIADNILVVEESIQKQQPQSEGSCTLPFADAEACFPFYALFRADERTGAIGFFLDALEEEARRFAASTATEA